MEKGIMKIGMYSPYIPMNFGGGEKHFFDVASRLSETHDVIIGLPLDIPTSTYDQIRKQYAAFFGQNVENISFIGTPLGSQASFIEKLRWTKQFDSLYYVTDGSLFFSLAHKNLLHVQIPFQHSISGFINRLKLRQWKNINTNSQFTRSVIENKWNVRVPFVHYPLVSKNEFDSSQIKKKIILGVGRFFTHLHAKRQDVLIEAFKKLVTSKKSFSDWELVLIGSVEDTAYFKSLKIQAKGYAIRFITNADRKSLLDWYAKATFFWHAAGYEVDEVEQPSSVEHFGIATIEAMASGAVPLVVYKGGQKEILNDSLSYLGWNTIDELLEKTHVLSSDSAAYALYQNSCRKSLDRFDEEGFRETLYRMFE